MPGEPVDWRAGLEVPDRHGVVLGPRDDASAVGAHRHGTHPTLMPGENSHEGGGFTQGSPAEDKCGTSEFGELAFGFFGQMHLPQGHGPEEDLLGEAFG